MPRRTSTRASDHLAKGCGTNRQPQSTPAPGSSTEFCKIGLDLRSVNRGPQFPTHFSGSVIQIMQAVAVERRLINWRRRTRATDSRSPGPAARDEWAEVHAVGGAHREARDSRVLGGQLRPRDTSTAKT